VDYIVSMSLDSRRTHRSSSSVVTVLLVVGVCVTGVLVDAARTGADSERGTQTGTAVNGRARHHQRRGGGSSHRGGGRDHHERPGQQVSDCSAVRQFARQTMHFSNALPATKSHGQ